MPFWFLTCIFFGVSGLAMENLLLKHREAKGLSQVELAKAAGTSQPQINRLETGLRKLTVEWAERLAPPLDISPMQLLFGNDAKVYQTEISVIGLRVEGTVQAGNFRDISLNCDNENDRKIISVAKDERFKEAHQYALEVAGDSMNLDFPEGCFVTCVSWGDIGLEMRVGMVFHVERYRAADLIETTIKEYAVIDGKPMLVPKSTNKSHMPIPVDNGDESTKVFIKGLVTGSWKPMVI